MKVAGWAFMVARLPPIFPLKDLGQINIASIVVIILDQKGIYHRCFVHNEYVKYRTASMEFGFRDVYHLSQ